MDLAGLTMRKAGRSHKIVLLPAVGFRPFAWDPLA